MNDTEFQAFLEQMRLTDADQFQTLCAEMATQAMRAYAATDGKDRAWFNASNRLAQAEQEVGCRAGN